MNPALVTELDRAGAALVQRLRALPVADRRDLEGCLDARNGLANDLAAHLKRWREAGAGTAAPRAADLWSGPVKVGRQRPRRVEGVAGR